MEIEKPETQNNAVKDIDALYSKLKKPVYLLALSILRSESLAEDVMQETFLKIIENQSALKTDKNIKSFIFKIAHNKAIDILRKQKREQPINTDFAVNSDYRYIEWSSDFLKATANFSEKEKTMLILHIFGGLSHSKISKIVDMTAVNVRVKYSRLLKKLKIYYSKKEL